MCTRTVWSRPSAPTSTCWTWGNSSSDAWSPSRGSRREISTTVALPNCRLIAAGLPWATTTPRSITISSSQSSSASSMKCVVSRIVRPRSFSSLTSCRNSKAPSGSRPAVGSSRKSTSGSVSRERARWSRCFMPREYSNTFERRRSPSPTRSSSSPERRFASRGERWLMAAKYCRFCSPVRRPKSPRSPPSARPVRRRTSRGCEATSKPATRALPSVGRSRVESMRTVVVLPAPFGPSRPKIVPGRTSNEMSLTATISLPRRRRGPPRWKTRRRFRHSIIEASMVIPHLPRGCRAAGRPGQ